LNTCVRSTEPIFHTKKKKKKFAIDEDLVSTSNSFFLSIIRDKSEMSRCRSSARMPSFD